MILVVCGVQEEEKELVSPDVTPRAPTPAHAKAAGHTPTQAPAKDLSASGPAMKASVKPRADGPSSSVSLQSHKAGLSSSAPPMKAVVEEAPVEELGDEVLDGVEVPLELMCPITHRLLSDPVIAMYERHTCLYLR